ncbi:MAG: hypothetical protein V1745_01170 [Patescibacteria group bacterium]
MPQPQTSTNPTDTTSTTTPSMPPAPQTDGPKRKLPLWVLVTLVFVGGLAIGGGAFALSWSFFFPPEPTLPTIETPPSITVTVPTTTEVVPGEMPVFDYNAIIVPTVDQRNMSVKVRWTGNEPADPDEVFAKVKTSSGTALTRFEPFKFDEYNVEQKATLRSSLMKRGVIVGGPFDGYALYFWKRYTVGMGLQPFAMKFLVSPDGKDALIVEAPLVSWADPKPEQGFTAADLYTNNGYEPWDLQLTLAPSIVLDATVTPMPKTLTTADGKTLRLIVKDWTVFGGVMCGLEGCVGDAPDLTIGAFNLYLDAESPEGAYVQNGGCISVYDELGNVRMYESVIQPESGDEYDRRLAASAISWNRGVTTLVTDYRPAQISGCGGFGCADVLTDEEVGPMASLIAVGKTRVGEPIYAPKDPVNHDQVKVAYEGWVTYTMDDTKPDIRAYVEKYRIPVFFWKDALGRWVRYATADDIAAVECGKPVIYLYPTVTTDVSVRLPSFIDVTVSEPAYPNEGWTCSAQPDGTLTMKDGTTFGSLYWEGTGVGYETPKDGFIVKDGEQETFLAGILPKYGLNPTETKEFMDFWIPEMQGAPYYRVSFLTKDWDAAAPLNVSPRPQTVIRLFMDWQKLDRPVDIDAPVITAPERKGFTLVEWGGLLR